jgi:hypothetical protein
MLQNATFPPARRTLEFGIYRDGDNNLDAVQEATLSQAMRVSETDSRIEFTVEDTTSLHGGELHTDDYSIAGGTIGHVTRSPAHDMSDEKQPRAVRRTNARRCGGKRRQTDVDRLGRSRRR